MTICLQISNYVWSCLVNVVGGGGGQLGYKNVRFSDSWIWAFGCFSLQEVWNVILFNIFHAKRYIFILPTYPRPETCSSVYTISCCGMMKDDQAGLTGLRFKRLLVQTQTQQQLLSHMPTPTPPLCKGDGACQCCKVQCWHSVVCGMQIFWCACMECKYRGAGTVCGRRCCQ